MKVAADLSSQNLALVLKPSIMGEVQAFQSDISAKYF